MFFIESLVKQFMPEWDEDTKLGITCISTTNPVYLIFHDHGEYPALVARVAVNDHVCETHRKMTRLYEHVGDLIPEPLGLLSSGTQQIAIQRGAEGTPWFQLSSVYATKKRWDELRDRALHALYQLHVGAAKMAEGGGMCRPGEELRQCFALCVKSGTKLSEDVISHVENMAVHLDKLGVVPAAPQHGDFCLNNLLVGEGDIRIIDFEDFLYTTMPLHDEFSLALSMYSQAPAACNATLKFEFNACTRASLERLGFENDVLPGFFMFHLLLRLGSWSQDENRAKYREWLMSLLQEFVVDPAAFIFGQDSTI